MLEKSTSCSVFFWNCNENAQIYEKKTGFHLWMILDGHRLRASYMASEQTCFQKWQNFHWLTTTNKTYWSPASSLFYACKNIRNSWTWEFSPKKNAHKLKFSPWETKRTPEEHKVLRIYIVIATNLTTKNRFTFFLAANRL